MVETQFSSHEQNHANEVQVPGQKAKHTKSAGVRVVGSRIYDSANGKTCHQCRQKTRDLAASCKNLKAGKPCPIKFCHKCLLNRYGEKAAEVELLSDWSYPKCRGVCNCSCCRVVLTTSVEWGALVTKLNVPKDWKEWQIYLVLLGLFLASAVAFYIFFENSDSFWKFPMGKDQPARPKFKPMFEGPKSCDDQNIWGPVDM